VPVPVPAVAGTAFANPAMLPGVFPLLPPPYRHDTASGRARQHLLLSCRVVLFAPGKLQVAYAGEPTGAASATGTIGGGLARPGAAAAGNRQRRRQGSSTILPG